MIKKTLVLGMLALVLLCTPSPASAQTATSTVGQVKALLKQIKELQDKIAELNKQQSQIIQDLREVTGLMRELRQGMTSEDVKALQEILAADPEIYPEGLITGYYGALTAKAVAKFQKKHGLEQVGDVGPKTRAKLNELLSNTEFKCGAWGRLIAPGQKKKVGNINVDLSNCDKIPGGILKKINATSTNATSTDRTAPVIKDIDVKDSGADSAEIKWQTNEKARGVLWHSDESDLDDAKRETVSTLSNSHEVEIENLDEGEWHYFRIVATDSRGNTATSSIFSFVAGEEDEFEFEDDEDSDDDDELEIEVEIEDGKAKVEGEMDGESFKFTLNMTDHDNIIEEIADRLDITEDEVEDVIEFEEEDDEDDDD